MTHTPLLTTIDRVKVFYTGATVTRRLTLTPDADGKLPESFEIAHLPLTMNDDSIRLRVLGDAQRDVLPRDLRVGLWVAPKQPDDPSSIEQTLKHARRELDLLQQQRRAAEAERDLLATMEVPDRPQGSHDAPPPAAPMLPRLAIDELIDTAVNQRLDALHKLRAQIARAQEHIASLEDQLRRISTAQLIKPEELSKTILATLQISASRAADAGPVELELDYFVPGARWAPQYQCRVNRAGDQAALIMRAVVAQRTGEDWRGVKLSLSTANPVGRTELPELPSIRIGRAQPTPKKRGFRPPPQGASLLFSDLDSSQRRLLAPTTPSWSPPSASVNAPDTSRWLQLVSLAQARRSQRMSGLRDLEAYADDYDEREEDNFLYHADEPAPEAVYESARMSSFGNAMPPPAPPALSAPPMPGAPMPQAAPSPASRSRAASPAKKSAMREEASEFERQQDRSIIGGAPADPSLDTPRFTNLQLAPYWDTHRRSKLQPVPQTQLYRDLLRRSRRELHFNLDHHLANLNAHAYGISSLSLPAGCSDVRSNAGFFDYTYQADDPVDVPSDASFHSINLGRREAPCDVQYVVVPREDTHVFRVAHITNPTRAPLLPGPVEVYVQDEYILTSSMPSVAPNQKLRLGLGVEQSIKCARNTAFEEQRSSEAVVATAELVHNISIELVNNLSRPISIEVRERIPQPAPKAEVVVEELLVSPAWEPWTQQEVNGVKLRGGRRWLLTMQPSQKTELRAEYTVKIYAKNELVGGNRRE